MSGKKILLIDITCPKPYDPDVLKVEPLGGSEASVVRLAEALAEKKHYRVTVAQHCRTEAKSFFANYVPLEGVEKIKADVVILFRKVELLPFVEKHFPSTKRILLLEDFNQQDLVENYEMLHDSGLKIVGVSRTHKTIIADTLLSQVNGLKGLTVDFAYNPIADDLGDIKVRPDPNKLVFFSSPHKGLEYTLEVFAKVRERWPEMRLHVANPGYYESMKNLPDGVVQMGELPHAEMMKELSNAFAVFHMNTVFPETQGIVHSEALALGVPVLTSGFGANREVLGSSEYVVDPRNIEAVLKKIEQWKVHRPVPTLNPEFRMQQVLEKWERLLR